MALLQTISPIDGSLYLERPSASPAEQEAALQKAHTARRLWKSTPVEQRQAYCSKMVAWMVEQAEAIGTELSWQMGRPVQYASKEITGGFQERAHYMIEQAPKALEDISLPPSPGLSRFIQRAPLGTVLVLAPWNYPYLTSVNAVIPALLAGNTVILKHANQTMRCAERYAEAAREAGLPEGVFQMLHLTHQDTASLIQDSRIDYVAFTGSVEGGRAVQHAARDRFIPVGLELGGKDPAYVRQDADLEFSVAQIIDGIMFNSGQSCCGIERVYVHHTVYDAFLEAAVALCKDYILGNPLLPETTLGPMVRTRSANHVRQQIMEARQQGAQALIDPALFPEDREETPYLAPQLLVNVDHSMRVMHEETFGPVAGIMSVRDDEEAIERMNDSPYGLTASIWSRDSQAALALADAIETGTCFLNRCDYLDPMLAWTGVKDSGRGCTLSTLGFAYLTRPKSFHFRL